MKRILKIEKGITLIALVITIVVLLILASVLIAMLTGSNGLITKANESKIQTVLAGVRETIQLEKQSAYMNNSEVTPETLLAEGKVGRIIHQGEDEKYHMYYVLKQGAYQSMQEYGKGNFTDLRDVFLIDDNLNIKYIDNNGKEYGDNIEDKILEDETQIRFSSKSFSEYVSKISGVTEGNMKFKWMKNQTSLIINDKSVDSLQDLVFFPNLTWLQIGEYGSNIPQITSMDGIENCQKLNELNIIYGPKKDYSALSKLINLKRFGVFGSTGGQEDFENIVVALENCDYLEVANFRNMKINNMKSISKLKKLTGLNLSINEIEKIEGIEKVLGIKTLDLNSNKLTDIKQLANLTNLQSLNLASNNIVDITPLKANTKLTYLDLKKNTNLNADRSTYTSEGIVALNKIGEILDRDGIINLDSDKLGLFTNYKVLDLSNAGLETLSSLENITGLERLNISQNKITLEDEKSKQILKKMQNLEELNIGNNGILDATVINSLKNLKILNISKNSIDLKQIEDIISNLNGFIVSEDTLMTLTNCDANKITSLHIDKSEVTQIPDLSKFTKLERLVIMNNAIKNIDGISKLSSLKTLNLTQVDLHGKVFDFSKLTRIQTLDLNSDYIWSEDLEKLKSLKNIDNLTLNLRNNSIIDATSLLELKTSTKIDLTGNINLTQDSKNKLKERFGNNVIF